MKSKKMKSLFTKVLGMAMALGLVMGTGVPVMAAGEVMEGTEAAPADAYLTKELQVAEGVTVPSATFSFKFEQVREDGGAPTAEMPAITDKNISYTNADTAVPDASGLKKIKKISGKILDGVTFTHAGEYEYKVTEVQTITGHTLDADNETMQFSKAEYKMRVIVNNKADGSGVYVKYVVVDRVLNDAGTAEAAKVNPGDEVTANTFMFTNVFTREGSLLDGKNPLEINKTVTGAAGDKTKEFDFSLTLTKSPTESATVTEYPAVITRADGTTENVTVPVGAAFTFKLKHGDTLSFGNTTTYPGTLPAGTRYTVTETGVNGYTTSAKVKENGGTETTIDNVTVTNKLVGDHENYAKYTNDKSVTPPTGIIINNLPFILLIGFAMGAFALFIVAKRRRSMR
ncbi:MAG: hypothetical protein PHP50_13505 [Lachnospiraceae bacterium]|nr:hypothetical protein [Lachnospiraceae bacterium]